MRGYFSIHFWDKRLGKTGSVWLLAAGWKKRDSCSSVEEGFLLFSEPWQQVTQTPLALKLPPSLTA